MGLFGNFPFGTGGLPAGGEIRELALFCQNSSGGMKPIA
jgi:hypothetical protein